MISIFNLRLGTAIISGHVATALIGIASLRLLTGLAPNYVFGEANLIMTFLVVLSQLTTSPFSATILRYQMDASARNVGDQFYADAIAWSVAASIALSAAVVFAYFLSTRLGDALPSWALAATGAWVVASAVKSIATSRLHAERRQFAFATYAVLEATLLAGCTAGALAVAASSSMYLLGQTVAVVAVTTVVIFTAPWPPLHGIRWPSTRGDFFKDVLAYGIHFAPLAVFGFLANIGDRYVLGYLLGPAAVGQYVAAFAISSRGLTMTNSALNDYFRPMLFDAENRSDGEATKRIFQSWIAASACIGGSAIVFIATLGSTIVYFLLADGYRLGAVEIMMWVAFAFTINGITQIIENRLLAFGASRKLIIPIIVGGAANVLFSIVLISMNGVVGAAQATCASFAIQGIATAFILRARLRHKPAQ